MKTLVLILFFSFIANAQPKKAPPSVKPSPTPASLQKQILESAASLKSAKTNDERITLLTALEKIVEADADKATVEGVRYSVALEPIFENRRDLGEKTICTRTRGDILHRFTSGSGHRGKIPDFVKDALEVLASACKDESLSADD